MYSPKPRSQQQNMEIGLPASASETEIEQAAGSVAPFRHTSAPLQISRTDLMLGQDAMLAPRVRILIVDDDVLVRETFVAVLTDEGYDAYCAASAVDARKLLETMAFDIMLCDMFMPGQNGSELLPEIIGSYPDMPVIMITGYASADMARTALHQGASDFITKPCNSGELPIVVERNLTRQAVARKNMLRYKMALQTSNESILDALLSALDTRDTETQGHSERVTAYTMEMADLMGISSEELYHIERGALLHDIGKIGIPDRILLKPGKLTEEEWVEMRKHPAIGYQMCVKIEMLKVAAQIVLHHHESWDGNGYPNRLKGEAIPMGARIFAVADTMDAITSDRPYRAGRSFADARAEIEKNSGSQFDPDVVRVFLAVPEKRWQHIRALADQ